MNQADYCRANTDWFDWVEVCEWHLQHSLDGDQVEDGYSLDFASVSFEANITVGQFLKQVSFLKKVAARVTA